MPCTCRRRLTVSSGYTASLPAMPAAAPAASERSCCAPLLLGGASTPGAGGAAGGATAATTASMPRLQCSYAKNCKKRGGWVGGRVIQGIQGAEKRD